MINFIKRLFSPDEKRISTKIHKWKDAGLHAQVFFAGIGKFGRYSEDELPKGYTFENCQYEIPVISEYGINFNLQNFVTSLKDDMITESEHILIPENIKIHIINNKLVLGGIAHTYQKTRGTDIDFSNCDIGLLNVLKSYQITDNGSLLSDHGNSFEWYPHITKHLLNIDGYDTFRLWVAVSVCQKANEYLRIYQIIPNRRF